MNLQLLNAGNTAIADFQQILSFIQQAEALLTGKGVELSRDERKSYGSIGEKNKWFVDTVLNQIATDPNLANIRGFDPQLYREIHSKRESLGQLLSRLKSMEYLLENIKIALDFNQMEIAQYYYRCLKHMAEVQNDSAAIGAFETLKQYYKPKKADKKA